jgi:hypothetical protein
LGFDSGNVAPDGAQPGRLFQLAGGFLQPQVEQLLTQPRSLASMARAAPR